MKSTFYKKNLLMVTGLFMAVAMPESSSLYAQPLTPKVVVEDEYKAQESPSASSFIQETEDPYLSPAAMASRHFTYPSSQNDSQFVRVRSLGDIDSFSNDDNPEDTDFSDDDKSIETKNEDVKRPLHVYSPRQYLRHVTQDVIQKQRLLEANDTTTPDTKDSLRVLSLDGGGVRGLMEIRLLEDLEKQSGRRIQDLFDIISGTSTGGILALGLSMGYSPTELAEIYTQHGEKIFPKSFIYQMYHRAWYGAKYSTAPLSEVLEQYFGSAKLSDLQVPILIPTYEINQDATMLFSSRKAKLDPKYDFYLKDVALATSAAPTYFSAQHIQNVLGDDFYCMDGGLSANNPGPIAVVEGLKIKPVVRENIILASLGTGDRNNGYQFEKLQYAGRLSLVEPVLDMMFKGASDLSHVILDTMLANDDYRQYYRLNPSISKEHEALDNASPENISALFQSADIYVNENGNLINELAASLTKSHKGLESAAGQKPASQFMRQPSARGFER